LRLRPGARGRRYLRVGALSAFLGLVLGYLTFLAIFPTVAVPVAGEPSLAAILLGLIGGALLAGFLSEDVFAITVQSFASLPVGVVATSAMVLSPVLTGMVQAQADELVFFVLRFGFPIYLLAIPVNLLAGLVGLGVRERLAPRYVSQTVRERGD